MTYERKKPPFKDTITPSDTNLSAAPSVIVSDPGRRRCWHCGLGREIRPGGDCVINLTQNVARPWDLESFG
ncbi:MAG: hypothetical protein LBL92_01420 [Propionibacteriaceae bacterium]|nr:hypothetical protein [Propionibacteriaceae bacterium]